MECNKHGADLTANEVSVILNKNYRTILRWIKSGKFHNAYKCECGAYLIPVTDVDAYIESLKL